MNEHWSEKCNALKNEVIKEINALSKEKAYDLSRADIYIEITSQLTGEQEREKILSVHGAEACIEYSDKNVWLEDINVTDLCYMLDYMQNNPDADLSVTIDFYQDIKVTLWKRRYFSLSGKSEEVIMEKAKTYIEEDILESMDVNIGKIEEVDETETNMTLEENDGYHTIELYTIDKNNEEKLIGMNGE